MSAPPEYNWSHLLAASGNNSLNAANVTNSAAAAAMLQHHAGAPPSIPTLAGRLETYRQMASGRMQTSMGGAILAANTIVSQSPRAVNYTTSLVERTRDLRNWLRQAKNEHEILTGMSMQMGFGGPGAVGVAGTAVQTVAPNMAGAAVMGPTAQADL